MEGSGRGIPRDRLSELPHSVILDILSLLPTRDAIKTTFLSKRWRNLWTNVHSLNFSTVDVCVGDEFVDDKVRSFVNRALLYWNGSKILKFNFVLGYNFDATTLAGDLDFWVRFAVYKNVEELNIKLVFSYMDKEWEDVVTSIYIPPQFLYSCSSITKLSLEGCNLKILSTPTWNHLKSLKLTKFCYTEDVINKIMLGSPLLEELELRLMERDADLNIQSTSLKKLKIDKCNNCMEPANSRLRIYCANLKTLEMPGVTYDDYRLENFSSLSDVTLIFNASPLNVGGMRYEQRLTKLRDLVSGLEQMERLTLSGWCFVVLSDFGNLLRSLPNVKFIKFSVLDSDLETLVDFLPHFPNLNMLVLEVVGSPEEDCSFIDKPLEPEEGPSTSSLPQLRAVEIRARIDYPNTFRFIVFLLTNFSMLQKLMISAYDEVDEYPPELIYKAARLLLSLQRSFPTTQVILNLNK